MEEGRKLFQGVRRNRKSNPSGAEERKGKKEREEKRERKREREREGCQRKKEG